MLVEGQWGWIASVYSYSRVPNCVCVWGWGVDYDFWIFWLIFEKLNRYKMNFVKVWSKILLSLLLSHQDKRFYTLYTPSLLSVQEIIFLSTHFFQDPLPPGGTSPLKICSRYVNGRWWHLAVGLASTINTTWIGTIVSFFPIFRCNNNIFYTIKAPNTRCSSLAATPRQFTNIGC